MATSVKPIPEGYHTVNTYLTVHDGRAAIEFLQKGLRGPGNVSHGGSSGKNRTRRTQDR